MYNDIYKQLSKLCEVLKADIESEHAPAKEYFPEIKVGDYVLVHDEEEPRSEYVDGITEIDGETVYLLSDGTWVTGDYSVSKYTVQGLERLELIEQLNRIL